MAYTPVIQTSLKLSNCPADINREYSMESAGVRYLRTSCSRLTYQKSNLTSEGSERVRFLIQKQRVLKYCTKHFPCGIVFIIYRLRFKFLISYLMTNQDKNLFTTSKSKTHAKIIT